MASKTSTKTTKKVTDAGAWKKNSSASGIDLEVPSGNVCRARRPGLKVFIARGMIPNNLLPMVNKAMNENKPPKDVKEAMAGADMNEVLDLVDKVTVYCVLEPDVQPEPALDKDGNELEERDPNALYVDEVDFEDKMFIFNWAVGGSADVERFRAEQASMLESLSTSETVGS